MEEALRVLRVLIQHGCLPKADIATTLAPGWFNEAGLDSDACLFGLATA